MSTYMAAASREGKKLNDVVFSSSAAAKEAIKKYGIEHVVNATVGCYAGDDEKVACLPVVEKVYKSLPMSDFITYAPPIGLADYRSDVIDATFEDQRPDGYAAAIATAGGTGAVHIAISNYSEVGDQVLTTDWRWSVYDNLCDEVGRHLTTFAMLDDSHSFNIDSFSSAVAAILRQQDSLLIMLNTPANNPTGFALSDRDWEEVLDVCRFHEKNGKRISILVDIAYIAYTGDKNEVRTFMKKFSHLPEHIFVMFAYSMSKGFTLYGQRAGALVGLSSSKDVIDEFQEVGKYSARTSWSNINRAAMTLLSIVRRDPALLKELETEENEYFQNIRRRADIFMEEARACNLDFVPYKAGFFISVPTLKSADACTKLRDDLIFAAPLARDILRNFFLAIPDSLYYSARVDGASNWRYLWRVMVPMSRPALVTIGLLDAIACWNSFLWTVIATNTKEVRTLPFGLYAFMTSSGIRYERLMAASTIVVVPMILLFIFCRKSIVTGVSRGGLKG